MAIDLLQIQRGALKLKPKVLPNVYVPLATNVGMIINTLTVDAAKDVDD